jgi:hypothetical protein
MKNDFKSMLEDFSNLFNEVSSCESLETLKESYSLFENKREDILEWIFLNNTNDEIRSQHLTEFAVFEHNLWVNVENGEFADGIPIFDDNCSFEDMDLMFENYGSYFQRYGCLTSDQIISWDEQNVLLSDESNSMEIVKRPDVLLNV